MLTPEEISSRKFLNALRGYDRLEVSEFLNEVADEHRALLERVQELEAREEQRDAREDGFDPRDAIGELGEETKRILLAAEEAAEEKRTRAEEDARTRLEEARKTAAEELEQARSTAAEELDAARRKAQKMVEDAQSEQADIASHIEELVSARDSFAAELSRSVDGARKAVERAEQIDTPAVVAAAPTAEDVEETVAEQEKTATTDEKAEPEALTPATDDEATDPEAPADEHAAEPDAESVRDEAGPPGVEADAGEQAGGSNEHSGNVKVVSGTEPEPAAGGSEDVETSGEEADDVEDVAAEGEPAGVGAEPASSHADAMALRRSALDAIRPDMVERLKSAIEGLEKGLLERLREAEDRDRVLTPDEEERKRLLSIGNTFLADAYRAGLEAGAKLAGVGTDAVAGDDSRVAHGAETLGDAITDEMRAVLDRTLNEGAEKGESAAQLSRRVRKGVKRLRNAVAEASASSSLLRLYELGVHDALSSADVPARFWLVTEEAECPDDVCATNAAEGAVALDASFPSGDVAPPAHPGCVCAIVPA